MLTIVKICKPTSRNIKRIFVILAFLISIHVTTIVHIIKSSDLIALQKNDFRNISKNFQSQHKILRKEKTMDQINGNDEKSQLDIKFFIIGVRKCGATALRTFLSEHPDVVVSSQSRICNPQPFASYKSIFSFLEYANRTKKVAIVEDNNCFHNIYEFDRLKKPSKIILLLCDPTWRAYSDYIQSVRTFGYKKSLKEIVSKAIPIIEVHKDDEDFAEYISNFRHQGQMEYSIVSIGFYYEYVKEYFKRYKWKDIFIVSGAALKHSPFSVIYHLESFLGIRHYLNKPKFVKNTTSGFYCIRQTLEAGIRCIETKNSKYFIPPDPATTKTLKMLYHHYNNKLFHLLNKRFPWI